MKTRHTGSPKYRNEISIGISRVYLYDIVDLFLAIYFVNRVNSKHPQISMSVINFQRKTLIFKELQVPP